MSRAIALILFGLLSISLAMAGPPAQSTSLVGPWWVQQTRTDISSTTGFRILFNADGTFRAAGHLTGDWSQAGDRLSWETKSKNNVAVQRKVTFEGVLVASGATGTISEDSHQIGTFSMSRSDPSGRSVARLMAQQAPAVQTGAAFEIVCDNSQVPQGRVAVDFYYIVDPAAATVTDRTTAIGSYSAQITQTTVDWNEPGWIYRLDRLSGHMTRSPSNKPTDTGWDLNCRRTQAL